MRVPTNRLSNNMMYVLGKSMTRIERVQIEMALGKKLLKPSDDPVGTRSIMSLHSLKSKNLQYQEGVSDGLRWIQSLENSLMDTTDILTRVKELVIQASNEMPEGRDPLGTEMNEILDELIAETRTMLGDRYILSGFSTTSAPYTTSNVVTGEVFTAGAVDAEVDLGHARITSGTMTVSNLAGTTIYTEGTDYSVDYGTGRITVLGGGTMSEGTDYRLSYETDSTSSVTLNSNVEGDIIRQIDSDREVSVNMLAPDVFQDDEDIFQMVIDLKNLLWRNDGDGVHALLDNVDNAIDHVTEQLGVVGIRTNSMENQQVMLESELIDIESFMGEIEGVDMAEAVVRLQAEQFGYQAALATTANLMQLSLVNYM